MKEIICLSNEPWSKNPGRTQQLITRIRDTHILYFSPPSSSRDFSWKKPGRKVKPNVIAFTLPPAFLSNTPIPFFQIHTQKKWGRFITQQARKHHIRNPLLWTSSPKHLHLLEEVSHHSLVYDCDRKWSGMPEEWEQNLAQEADVVFTLSPNLRERLSPYSPNIAIIPNGVNFPLFSGQDIQPHPNVVSLPSPVLGWLGTISPDLDLSPLLYAAHTRPEWTFLLIGEKSSDNPYLDKLLRHRNVISIPPCALMELPEYLAKCNVLLNFLHTDRPYDDVIPRRIYEYLSTGKPVVSMLWPDQVETFPDVIYGANTPEEFIHLCSRALEENPNWLSQRRRDHGASASWSNRADEITAILIVSGLL